MKESSQDIRLSDVPRAKSAVYSRPTLTEFGPVGALTQAGSVDGSEVMNNMCNPSGMNVRIMC